MTELLALADDEAAALWEGLRLCSTEPAAHPQRATFENAALLAREAGASFFVDEVYRFLEHEPGMRLPAAAEIGSWGVSLGVMSKAFGLAGLRIGWLASTDEDLLARCARVK